MSETTSPWEERNTIIANRAAVLLAPHLAAYWSAQPDDRATMLRDFVDLAAKLDAAAAAY